MKRLVACALSVVLTLSALFCFSPASAKVSPEDYDTSMPSFIYDFSHSLYESIVSHNNFTMDDSQGYLHLTALGDDPATALNVPAPTLDQMVWAAFRYRVKTADPNRYAEIYYAASNGEQMAENTKMKWAWEDQSGEWATQTVYLSSFDNKPGVFLTSFRLDALAADYQVKVKAGDVIDLDYFALFPTEEAANAFNVDEYRRYVRDLENEPYETEGETEPHVIEPGDWTVPAEAGVRYIPGDNADGSLSMTHNEDGTLTISYLLNGKTVSYTVPDTLNYASGPLVGTDDLGRTLWDMYTEVDPDYTMLANKTTADGVTKVSKTKDADPFTIGTVGERGTREIGIFYFLWLGEHGDSGILDITKILEQYGEGAASGSCPGWGPVNAIHHFAEPLYGYYYSIDTWVMRKHVELLTNAGIDFLYFDTTNNYAYVANVVRLMQILHEFNERGWDAPQICFYTHTDAVERVKTIYAGIYAKELYPDTWYRFDGKPLIIAPAAANVDGFFTTREPQWPNETQKNGSWPWIDWNWPQKVYRNEKNRPEAVSVSVAQHAGNGCFSESGLYGYEGNWGRSFNGTNDLLTADSYKLGLNIQNEFNYAMTVDTPVVLVTGWNEWIAGRQSPVRPDQPVCFIDTFSYEYSRDIEMSRGGYFDNYYMQLISNISALKGAAPTIVQDERRIIDVTGSFDQWDDVAVTYSDPAGDTVERNALCFGHGTLTDTTGRNDITAVKMTGDQTYLYVYVQTADTIVRPEAGTDSTWMQVFLNVDGQQTGWYGYDFILNNHPKDDLTTTLAAYSASEGYGFTDTQEIAYRVLGNEIMFAVPYEYLGITACDRVCIGFKAADSDTLIDEMEDFYIEGDAAPLGRPNFVYQTYIPGVTEGEGTPIVTLSERMKAPVVRVDEIPGETEAPDTVTETDPATAPATEPATEAPTDPAEPEVSGTGAGSETETDAPAGGCKSLAGGMICLMLAVTAALPALRRRDE